jgi:hypothetical protein
MKEHHESATCGHVALEGLSNGAGAAIQAITRACFVMRLRNLSSWLSVIAGPFHAVTSTCCEDAGAALVQHRIAFKDGGSNPGTETADSHFAQVHIARGMAFLHQQRPVIVHNDLKTGNLLVGANYEVKVLALRLARETVVF